ncbi:MAG TPA: hypothetical protein VM120_10575 [Bryobacteraceae bacterium]|nr:hypothetical protein [Bryobacteraceae bacterium]
MSTNGQTQTIHLAEIHCPHCYLSTRADYERCLHCRKALKKATKAVNGRNEEAASGAKQASRDPEAR